MVATRFRGLILLAGCAWAALAAPALSACPFCTERGPTLIGDYNQASMVLFGKFTNAKLASDNDFGGTTDFVVEKVVKRDDKNNLPGDKKVITLPRYVPPTKSK